MRKLNYRPMHKVVSLDYPLRDEYYCAYLLKEELEEKVVKYFEQFGLVEFKNFSIDFNTGISGSYCYLDFPYEMSDEEIQVICEKIIDFLHNEDFIDKNHRYEK